MDTNINDKTVMPRVYQAYGDNIGSKQAMEPLAIAHGVGPVCGFDHLEYDEDSGTVTIGSIYDENFLNYYKDYPEAYKLLCANHKQQTWLSDKTNNSGVVYNAFVSPSGLLHIAPRTIIPNTDPEIISAWPQKDQYNQYTSGIVVCLIASFNYIDGPYDYDNTSVTWSLKPIDITDYPIPRKYYGWTLEEWQSKVSSLGLMNSDTDCLIGVYLVGFSSLWSDSADSNIGLDYIHEEIHKKFNYLLPLIPYEGRLTPFNTNILGMPLLSESLYQRLPRAFTLDFNLSEVYKPGSLDIFGDAKIYSLMGRELNTPLGCTISNPVEGTYGNDILLQCVFTVPEDIVSENFKLSEYIEINSLIVGVVANNEYSSVPDDIGLPSLRVYDIAWHNGGTKLVIRLLLSNHQAVPENKPYNVKLTANFISKQPIP